MDQVFFDFETMLLYRRIRLMWAAFSSIKFLSCFHWLLLERRLFVSELVCFSVWLALVTWCSGSILSWYILIWIQIDLTNPTLTGLHYSTGIIQWLLEKCGFKVHPGCQIVNGSFVGFGGWIICLCLADFEIVGQKFNFFFFTFGKRLKNRNNVSWKGFIDFHRTLFLN